MSQSPTEFDGMAVMRIISIAAYSKKGTRLHPMFRCFFGGADRARHRQSGRARIPAGRVQRILEGRRLLVRHRLGDGRIGP